MGIMKTITLYHGTLSKIDKFKDANNQGLYFTPRLEIANNYIISQNDNKTGLYGFIYKVEVLESDIENIENIDDIGPFKKVQYNKEDNYYRIDYPSLYNIVEMTDKEISVKIRL
jgi:hypothetical protein